MGFSGSGKSTLLKRLNSSGDSFFRHADLDCEVEKRLGVSIAKYVESNGWEVFREKESQELSYQLNKTGPHIICVGAGAISDGLGARLKDLNIFSVHLDIPFELCWARIEGDGVRPLVRKGKEFMQQLYNERRVFYKQADICLDAEGISQVKSAQDLFSYKG